MSVWYTGSGAANPVVVIPRIWVTSALSILVHLALLIALLPWLAGHTPWRGQGDTGDRLEVELASQSGAVPVARTAPMSSAPSVNARTVSSARVHPPSAPLRTATPTLVVAAPQAPAIAPPPRASIVASLPASRAALESAQATPSVGGDLSSSIAARRRAREEPSMAAENDAERQNRILASNVPALRSPIIDEQRRRGGGIFEITRMAYDDAEFLFFGWSSDERRRKTQAYEVRLGDNRDMRVAVVRRMIAIIREHEQGDFRWQSWRLGRIVLLSARPEDDAGLENFMLQEFFESKPTATNP
jgi:hypothetical protein